MDFKLTEQQEIKAAGGHLEDVQAAIHAHLTVIQDGTEADSELSEFVTVMLNNQKTLDEIATEVGQLLIVDESKMDSAANKFCLWLKKYLIEDLKSRDTGTDGDEGSAARLAKRLLGGTGTKKRSRGNMDLSLEEMVAANKRQKQEKRDNNKNYSNNNNNNQHLVLP